MKRTDHSSEQADRVAVLHAEAAAEYGSRIERAARADAASQQKAEARCHGNEAAGAWKGRR